MNDQPYIKRGNRYQPVGREFEGFPADGIWLVADGRQSCLIRLCDIGSLPPITALPYLALAEEAAMKATGELLGQAASRMDIARKVALFFAEKADDEISKSA